MAEKIMTVILIGGPALVAVGMFAERVWGIGRRLHTRRKGGPPPRPPGVA